RQLRSEQAHRERRGLQVMRDSYQNVALRFAHLERPFNVHPPHHAAHMVEPYTTWLNLGTGVDGLDSRPCDRNEVSPSRHPDQLAIAMPLQHMNVSVMRQDSRPLFNVGSQLKYPPVATSNDYGIAGFHWSQSHGRIKDQR